MRALTYQGKRDVQVIIATDDRGEWTPTKCAETAATMRNARPAVVKESCSLPSLEGPTELAAVIEDFWAESNASSGVVSETGPS